MVAAGELAAFLGRSTMHLRVDHLARKLSFKADTQMSSDVLVDQKMDAKSRLVRSLAPPMRNPCSDSSDGDVRACPPDRCEYIRSRACVELRDSRSNTLGQAKLP